MKKLLIVLLIIRFFFIPETKIHAKAFYPPDENENNISEILTSKEFKYLLGSDYNSINKFLQSKNWYKAIKTNFYDIIINTWTSPDHGWDKIILEHGEGYENSIIYETNNKNNFDSVLSKIDLKAMKKLYNKTTNGRKCEGYTGLQDNVIIMAFPVKGNEHKSYIIIFTSTDNIDSLWFESKYINY